MNHKISRSYVLQGLTKGREPAKAIKDAGLPGPLFGRSLNLHSYKSARRADFRGFYGPQLQ